MEIIFCTKEKAKRQNNNYNMNSVTAIYTTHKNLMKKLHSSFERILV